MRISDWSSDVCSSDLYEACFYRTPTGDYGFPTIGLKAAMVGACRFVDMKMTEARGAFHIDGEMLTVQGEPRPRADMVRSEEHTSELQSLMRISYAVFSLKNKTRRRSHSSDNHTYELRTVNSTT